MPSSASKRPVKLTRVLMTADAVGGVWTCALELARGLESADVEVILAVLGGGLTPAKRAEAGALSNLTLAEFDCQLEWMQDPWADVDRAGDWLLDLASLAKPDLVHLNGYAHAALPWPAPTVVVAHSCVFSWHRAVRRAFPGPAWDTYYARVRQGLHAATLVVAPSQAMLRALVTEYGSLPHSRVIANGRDATVSTEPKQPFVFTAGRLWDEAKNIRTLAAAAPSVAWPILVAGDPAHPEGGAQTFPQLQLLGPLSTAEMHARYAHAALYALPALYEPFGYTALEAASHACALVLSDIDSLREIWASAALFVPPDDAPAWSHVLNRLIAEPALLGQLAAAAQLRASAFTRANMTNGYLHAYTQAYHWAHNQPCGLSSSAIPCDLTGTTETPTFSAA